MKTCYFIDGSSYSLNTIFNIKNLNERDELYFFTKYELKFLPKETLKKLNDRKIKLKIIYIKNLRQREDILSFSISTYLALNTKKQKKFNKYRIFSNNQELIDLKSKYNSLGFDCDILKQ